MGPLLRSSTRGLRGERLTVGVVERREDLVCRVADRLADLGEVFGVGGKLEHRRKAMDLGVHVERGQHHENDRLNLDGVARVADARGSEVTREVGGHATRTVHGADVVSGVIKFKRHPQLCKR